jgi:hypothetical protein
VTAVQKLARWERWVLGALVVTFVAFGFLVERRSAFLRRRMGDLGCYLRAGWAVRAGVPIYGVVDDNDWHYNYPPLYAILMAPLADPPPGSLAPGFVPYPASVAIVYVLNLGWLFLAVHWLAGALERTSRHVTVRNQPAGCRRWWLLRVVPILVCIVPLGHTLMRGQVNTLLLALVCGSIAATLHGRRFLAGLSLAGAICLKIFPGFLLLLPLCRRDGRCLAGCFVGLVVGLGVVPLAVLGTERTAESYRDLARVLIAPALNVGGDDTRDAELTGVTATDSQSFRCVLHNLGHLYESPRPRQAAPWVQPAHWLLGGSFTLLTLLAGRRLPRTGPRVALFAGALTLIMILVSPVCHTHYFTLAVPAVLGLLALAWERYPGDLPQGGGLGAGVFAILALQVLGNALPLLPDLVLLKDGGLAALAALALWLAACVAVRRPEVAVGTEAVGHDFSAAA